MTRRIVDVPVGAEPVEWSVSNGVHRVRVFAASEAEARALSGFVYVWSCRRVRPLGVRPWSVER